MSSAYTLFALLASVISIVNAGDDDWESPVVSLASGYRGAAVLTSWQYKNIFQFSLPIPPVAAPLTYAPSGKAIERNGY